MATGDSDDFTARTRALLPPWFPDWSVSSVVSGVIAGWAAVAAILFGLLSYVKAQTRILTASDAWLDIISYDYFGLRVSRVYGESDSTFKTRIIKELLRTRNTRGAIIQQLLDTTGNTSSRVIESFNPADTGAWDECFWDVDSQKTPFRWAGNYPYQFFVVTTAPFVVPFGNYPTPGYDVTGFWDTALYLIDSSPSLVGRQAVYDAINATKAAGTTAWVAFL